jgi:hypothetical protein
MQSDTYTVEIRRADDQAPIDPFEVSEVLFDEFTERGDLVDAVRAIEAPAVAEDHVWEEVRALFPADGHAAPADAV